MQKLLRWLGHVKRMDDSRFPKTVLFSEARDGSRKQGRPLFRYHDNCKSDMKSFDMNVDNWALCAMQRSSWRENVTMGARRCEQALIQRKEESRKRRKQPLINFDAKDDMMHLFVNTATSATVQELDCLAISGLIRTKTLFNAYTMIFKFEGCLL